MNKREAQFRANLALALGYIFAYPFGGMIMQFFTGKVENWWLFILKVLLASLFTLTFSASLFKYSHDTMRDMDKYND